MNNLILIIPSLNELLGFFIFLILLYSFSVIGSQISGLKDLPINLTLGWSIFVILFHFFTIIFNTKLSFFFIIYIFIFILFYIFSKEKLIQKENFKSFYFLAPLLIILISTKSFGWDTFAFYLPRTDFLLKFNELPTDIFRSNYPFTNSILYHFVNFFFNKNIESIPAIFDFVLLFLSSLVFVNIFRLNKSNIINIIPFIFLIVFFNPIVMNVYSYSAYEDLQVSFAILISVYFLYLKDFCIQKFNYTDSVIIGLIFSLLSLNKITGVVHLFSISLFFIIINLKIKNINAYNIKKLLIIFLIPIVQLLLWTYHIYANEIFVAKEISGFRDEIFKNIMNGYYKQFFQKKLLISSIFIIPIFSIIFFFLKKFLKKIYSYY